MADGCDICQFCCSLFLSVNEDRFQTGSYPSFIALLDGFNPQIGEADPNLDAEISAFLDDMMSSDPMQEAYTCVGPSGWGKYYYNNLQSDLFFFCPVQFEKPTTNCTTTLSQNSLF